MPEIDMGPSSPFFIVYDIDISLTFYVEKLGFACRWRSADFGIVIRGGAQLMLKSVPDTVPPLPNSHHNDWASWDAFICLDDPESLAQEYAAKGVGFHKELTTTSDGLRGFEMKDPDGYISFFGKPV